MNVTIDEFIGKRTIILGDINRGKSSRTLEIMNAFLKAGLDHIALIDMAPETPSGVGGKIAVPPGCPILCLSPDIAAPRLMGRTEEEIEALARTNAEVIEELFDRYLEAPRDILFINDLSFYLHAGRMERLFQALALAKTQILNSYYGRGLGESDFSRRERERVDELAATCERVIVL